MKELIFIGVLVIVELYIAIYYESRISVLKTELARQVQRTKNTMEMLKEVDAERNQLGYANEQLIEACEPKSIVKAIRNTPLPLLKDK